MEIDRGKVNKAIKDMSAYFALNNISDLEAFYIMGCLIVLDIKDIYKWQTEKDNFNKLMDNLFDAKP